MNGNLRPMKGRAIAHSRVGLRTGRPRESRLQGLMFLVLGGSGAIATALFTLFHPNDHDIVRATVPGFLFGFGLLVAFAIRNHPKEGTD